MIEVDAPHGVVERIERATAADGAAAFGVGETGGGAEQSGDEDEAECKLEHVRSPCGGSVGPRSRCAAEPVVKALVREPGHRPARFVEDVNPEAAMALDSTE